jgi:LacI family transcriptional regulator
MADVAEKAGVSTSTVSLVLNDKPGISPEVRAAVMKVVNDLGYRARERRSSPNSLSETKSKTISVVHFASPEADYGFDLSNVFVDFVAGIQEYLQKKNANWVLIPNYHDWKEDNLGFRLFQDGKFSASDGLILLGLFDTDCSLLQNAIKDKIPVVVLSRYWPELPISTVSQEHRQHARLALDHLIQLGHRKIAFLARDVDRHFDWFDLRLTCYQEAMNQLGEPVDQDLITVETDGAKAAKLLMARRPDVTAIFAVHDENAIQAMRGLCEIGLKVPQDVSVIGLDNANKPPEDYPALTTVAFPHHKVGQLATELLLRQIEDEELFYGQLFVRSHLIERDSCGQPRG